MKPKFKIGDEFIYHGNHLKIVEVREYYNLHNYKYFMYALDIINAAGNIIVSRNETELECAKRIPAHIVKWKEMRETRS